MSDRRGSVGHFRYRRYHQSERRHGQGRAAGEYLPEALPTRTWNGRCVPGMGGGRGRISLCVELAVAVVCVLSPAIDRISREPFHLQILEEEATHYGVRLHYADAPSGDDPFSQMTRQILASAAKVTTQANFR